MSATTPTQLSQLREYERLLKQAADAKIAVQLFEMRLRIERNTPPRPETSKLSRYLLENVNWLTEEEIEFLQLPSHSPAEVAKRMDCSNSTVKRLCDSGRLPFTKTESGRYRIDSLAVMEHLDRVKTGVA